MEKLVMFFLAILPILWLILSLSGMKLAAYKACPIALLLTVVLALTVWKFSPLNTLTAGLEGAAMALWPIILVIIAAVFTYNLSVKTGNMDLIKEMLTGVTTDRRILVLIIAWGFGGFLEGMAGFGTAVAIPASMLIALGFDPMFSAAVCLVANATPTAFGSIGIPTTTVAQIAGLNAGTLSRATALQLFPLVILTPFILVMMTRGSEKRPFRGVGITALVSGLSFAVPELAVASTVGAELPVIVGSICSMICTILCGRAQTRRNPVPAFQVEGTTTENRRSLSFGRALVAWLPFVLIFALLTLTSSLVPPVHNALSAIKTSVRIYTGEGAAPYTFTWINTPGVLILIAALIGGAVQGAGLGEMLRVLGATIRQMSKTIITMLAVLSTAKIMGYSGMIAAIAGMMVGVSQAFYPLFAPLIGSLGAFITGSATSSSVLFGKLQTEAAGAIGVNRYWLAASNTVGATAGKMISPQNIAIAVAATNLAGKEGKLLNSTIRYFVLFVVLMGLIVYFGASLTGVLF